jgi:hypothetical protein
MNERMKLIPIKSELIVTLRDKEGNVKDVRKFENNDLLTRGFFRYFYAFWCNKDVSVQDEDGGWRGVNRGRAMNDQAFFVKVAIGESDTPPSASDYKLYLKVSEVSTLGITDLIETGNKAEFDVTAKLSVPVERDIGEIGLFGRHRWNYYGEWSPYLFARDIFSPKIHMTTSDILDVRYRFTLGVV